MRSGPGTYRNERPYPFCPGCGHGPILDAVNAALVARNADPAQVVIVSDIGCSGLSDQYFDVGAFHGLHGRSITYASGIKLARPDLDVLVVMGDGGTGIGGAHLIAAARRNIGITVLVFNNLNFGMTGGQHSATTPPGGLTPTTWAGNLERPLDVCATAAVNGAGYVYRGTSFDDDLGGRIAEAMGSGGFAILDVWELCTAYYVRRNRFGRKSIDATLAELGFAKGVLQRLDRPEYAVAYREAHHGAAPPDRIRPGPIPARFESPLDHRATLVVAGAAGGKVRSAVRLAGQAAISAGLWAAQRDDYPVTVKSGHSVSTLILDPEPIDHAGAAAPDVLAVLAPEGRAKAAPLLERMGAGGLVLVASDLAPVTTRARTLPLDFGEAGTQLGPAERALAAVTAAVGLRDLFPVAALAEAVSGAAHPDRARAAVEAGARLAGR